MNKIVSTQVSGQTIQSVWRMFATAIGNNALRNAYGPHWPRDPIDQEFLYTFSIESQVIGWGSLIYDATELVTWHTHGVFPDHQDQGITRDISRRLRSFAFTLTPCVAVCCRILDTNARYQEWMKNKNPNPGWQYAGHIALPVPGYDVYSFSRDFWETNEREIA